MTSKKPSKRRRVNSSDSDSDGEDGAWECTVCTYRNRFESFKCEMCDSRKGTSTRKPRMSSTFVEQQAQMEKTLEAAKSKAEHRELRERERENSGRQNARGAKAAAAAGIARGLRDDSMSPLPPKPGPSRASRAPSPSAHSNASSPPHHANVKSASLQPPPVHTMNNRGSQPPPGDSPSSAASAPTASAMATTTTATTTPSATTTTTTTSSKSSYYGRLKNVDRQSARTLAVTVNGMTIVVTDYQLKPKKPSSTRNSKRDKSTTAGAGTNAATAPVTGENERQCPSNNNEQAAASRNETLSSSSSTAAAAAVGADNSATSVTPPAIDPAYTHPTNSFSA